MNALDTEFHRRLRKRLDELFSEKAEDICLGQMDFELYRRESGYLAALRDVGVICTEVESDMNRGE